MLFSGHVISLPGKGFLKQLFHEILYTSEGLAQWWENSHQCGPGSISRLGVICGLSLLVLYSAPRGFSPGTPVFPSPHKPIYDLICVNLISVYSVPNRPNRLTQCCTQFKCCTQLNVVPNSNPGCRDGAVVRTLASHQWGPGSILRLSVICGLSLLVLYSAPRGFLRV